MLIEENVIGAFDRPLRVLYSFPNKLGATRICYTAWQQVNGLAEAGAEVVVYTGDLLRPVPPGVKVHKTLAWGKLRIPYKAIGSKRALALHDRLVAHQLPRLAGAIDIVHTWPSGALRTLRAARAMDLPTVLERPNAHTRFAMEAVKKECEKLGVTMPSGHEHGDDPKRLRLEEEEFDQADRLLCPSDFVARTFVDKGFPPEKLARHQYGYDDKAYSPDPTPRSRDARLTMLFVGGCAPRKGLHYALEAWLRSPAHADGEFLIAGEFIPGYAERLSSMLSHRSVKVLGHRRDVPALMRKADIFVLPSIEEGSALVTSEARGSGCVLLVSEAAGAICKHMQNSLVHAVADTESLTAHISMLYKDRSLLQELRFNSLQTLDELTWGAAGRRLLAVYRETIEMHRHQSARTIPVPSLA